MNTAFVLYNLKESLEQLTSIIKDLENDDAYEKANYSIDMQHLYHHLNTAWNAQETSIEESNNCSEQDFSKWRQFPSDIYMGV